MTTNHNLERPSSIQDKHVSKMTLGGSIRMICLSNLPNFVWQVLATNEKTKIFFKCHQAGDYQSKAGRWWFCWYVQILIISNLSITKLKHIFSDEVRNYHLLVTDDMLVVDFPRKRYTFDSSQTAVAFAKTIENKKIFLLFKTWKLIWGVLVFLNFCKILVRARFCRVCAR